MESDQALVLWLAHQEENCLPEEGASALRLWVLAQEGDGREVDMEEAATAFLPVSQVRGQVFSHDPAESRTLSHRGLEPSK
jgi:hypothetical protein